ncbi:MAG: response regulator transcription factor [Gemmatimonadota bacterium]
MPPRAVLIVDDEPQIRRVVRNAFKADFPRVLEAETGAQGVDLAAAERPDLVILDLGLPDLSGLDVCREIRKWSAVPIVVLTARHSEDEKVTLLDAGADDYLTKPFSPAELQARVRAVLRRSGGTGTPATRLEQDGLVMDLHQRELRRDGVAIHLTPIEWELLRVLMSQPGRTLTHQQLFREVWTGRAFGDAQQYLRVYVAQLRRKIEPDPVRPQFIVTEPGVGYRFKART